MYVCYMYVTRLSVRITESHPISCQSHSASSQASVAVLCNYSNSDLLFCISPKKKGGRFSDSGNAFHVEPISTKKATQFWNTFLVLDSLRETPFSGHKLTTILKVAWPPFFCAVASAKEGSHNLFKVG